MSFLNAILLGGTAAMLAPLLLHLLNRSRYRTLDWGAMHLIEAAVQSNSRRLQWEQWLLLFIRCLIPILLAVALARPVLTSYQLDSASGSQAMALLLDDSLSMSAESNGQTLLEHARDALGQVVDAAGTTEFALWTTSSPPQDQLDGSVLQSQIVRAALTSIGPPAGTSSSTPAILAGARHLQSISAPHKQLVLVSDFQASQWRNLSDGQLQSIRQRISSKTNPPSSDRLSLPQLYLLPIGPATSTDNVSAHSLDASAIAHLGTPYLWTTRITNHGDQPLPDLELVLNVDGQRLVTRRVSLAPHANEQVEFECEFTQLGWHHLTLSAADPSSVHGDDQCYAVVHAKPQPHITIIDDSLSDEQDRAQHFSGVSRYLKIALAPLPKADQNAYSVELISSAAASGTVLQKTDGKSHAVIIADVSQWTEDLLGHLKEFVRQGGGLLIFEQQSAQQQELTIQRQRWNELAPSMFASLPGELRSVAANKSVSLDGSSQQITWMAWNSAADFLPAISFTRWRQLNPNSSAIGPRTLLTLSNGDPWLVEHEFGQGIVLQCASSCGDDGTNMPRQPGYVPLMQSLAERLTQHSLRSPYVMNGESISLQVSSSNRELTKSPRSQVDATISIRAVETDAVEAEAGAPLNSGTSSLAREWPVQEGRVVVTATQRPGIYSAQLNTSSSSALGTDRSNLHVDPALYAVSLESTESQLTPLTTAELKRLADKLGATLIFSAKEFDAEQKLQRDGWELWRWIMLAVLVLLFAELLFGFRLSGASPTIRGLQGVSG